MADVQIVLTGIDNATGVINAVSAAFSGNLTAAIDLAQRALSVITNQFTGFLKSAIEGEDAATALDFAIRKQGEGAVITAEQGAALAESLKNLVGGQNDTVISAEAVLLKFHEINKDAFPGALRLSADLAASMGTDMSSAAQTLGKALENPATAMRLIKTVGGEVDPEFAKIIKRMVDMGDIADADSAIMNKLNEVIGGKAANAASTLSGQWKTMMGNLSDLGQKIGDDFLPVLHVLFDNVVTPGIKLIELWGDKMAAVLSVFKSGDLLAGITNLWADLLIAVPVLQQVQGRFFQVVDFFKKNWPLIQETARTVWNDLQIIFGELTKEITAVLIPAISKIWGESAEKLPKAQDVFTSVMGFITAAMRGVVLFITDRVMPTVTAMVNWVVDHWPQIQHIAEQVFGAIGSALGALRLVFDMSLTSMGAAANIFKDILTGKWSDIGTQLKIIWDSNWGTMKIILGGALESIIKAITSLDWRGTGMSIMRQFVQGVQDEAYNVVAAIFGAPYRAWQALSGQFGMNTGPTPNLYNLARFY